MSGSNPGISENQIIVSEISDVETLSVLLVTEPVMGVITSGGTEINVWVISPPLFAVPSTLRIMRGRRNGEGWSEYRFANFGDKKCRTIAVDRDKRTRERQSRQTEKLRIHGAKTE